MASNNEKTFGSKLTNAETLATHLTTFTAYVPVRPEESVVNYKALITAIKTNNTLVASEVNAKNRNYVKAVCEAL